MLSTIITIRPMTTEELAAEGWEGSDSQTALSLIETSDGSIYYPANDIEGTKPGEWVAFNRQADAVPFQDVASELIGQQFPFLNHGRRDNEQLRQWYETDPCAWIDIWFDCRITLKPDVVFGRLKDGTPFLLG
jgi:hypothetical protein